MPVSMIDYSEFMNMFEPSQDFSAYGHGDFEIEWRSVECKNPVWCAFLWKPNYDDYEGEWIRQEYNGSSSFAMWWSENSNEINDGSDEE